MLIANINHSTSRLTQSQIYQPIQTSTTQPSGYSLRYINPFKHQPLNLQASLRYINPFKHQPLNLRANSVSDIYQPIQTSTTQPSGYSLRYINPFKHQPLNLQATVSDISTHSNINHSTFRLQSQIYQPIQTSTTQPSGYSLRYINPFKHQPLNLQANSVSDISTHSNINHSTFRLQSQIYQPIQTSTTQPPGYSLRYINPFKHQPLNLQTSLRYINPFKHQPLNLQATVSDIATHSNINHSTFRLQSQIYQPIQTSTTQPSGYSLRYINPFKHQPLNLHANSVSDISTHSNINHLTSRLTQSQIYQPIQTSTTQPPGYSLRYINPFKHQPLNLQTNSVSDIFMLHKYIQPSL